MDRCAQDVLAAFPDVRLAYGQSDEYSFVFKRDTKLYDRRSSKLVSLVVSCFTGAYVSRWPEHLPGMPLRRRPLFDGRAVAYPDLATLRDYLAWRQVDTHINNQYNQCFWLLVRNGKSPREANQELQGTQTAFKNELLFQHGINYNDLPARVRRGSIVISREVRVPAAKHEGVQYYQKKRRVEVLHEDLIKEPFWTAHPDVL